MLVVRYATGLRDHVVAPTTFPDLACQHDVDTMLTVSTFLSQAVHIGYVAWYFLYIYFTLAWNLMGHVRKRAFTRSVSLILKLHNPNSSNHSALFVWSFLWGRMLNR